VTRTGQTRLGQTRVSSPTSAKVVVRTAAYTTENGAVTKYHHRSSPSKWSTEDDENLAVDRLYEGCAPPFVSDAEMTSHFLALGVEVPGTPDATILAGGPSSVASSSTWKEVTFVQVCRAYSRRHLHAMICEKVFKSSLWMSSARSHVAIDLDRFVITVFVPSALSDKALRVAAWCNVLLLESCFEVMIIPNAGEVEEMMFGFSPRASQLIGGRKFKEVGEVCAAMESGSRAALRKRDVIMDYDGADEIRYAFARLFNLHM